MHKIQFLLILLRLNPISFFMHCWSLHHTPSVSFQHHIIFSLSHSFFNPFCCPSPSFMQSCNEHDSLAIPRQNILDPRQKKAHFGVNAGVVGQGTALAPGDDAMQLVVTHKGTAGVTLSNGEEGKSYIGPSSQAVLQLYLMCDELLCVCTWQASLPPSRYKHTPCGQWSCQGRSFHSPCQIEWELSHIGG